MLKPTSPLAALLDAPIRPGVVTWIGLRPARRAEMEVVAQAEARGGEGLVGDRWRGRPEGGRQVTLIAAEDLAAIAAFQGAGEVVAQQLRRNIVTRGVNLVALKGWRFRVGGALLEYSGECHPCSRMEETLGVGGYNAVRGRGGITARVIAGGVVAVGDAVAREG